MVMLYELEQAKKKIDIALDKMEKDLNATAKKHGYRK